MLTLYRMNDGNEWDAVMDVEGIDSGRFKVLSWVLPGRTK
jgi:hypothetical protein